MTASADHAPDASGTPAAHETRTGTTGVGAVGTGTLGTGTLGTGTTGAGTTGVGTAGTGTPDTGAAGLGAPSGLEFRPIHISGYDRRAHDFYPTPDWVTQALLAHTTLRGPVWEPCCGDGAMARVIERAGHAVVATDLVDRGFGRGGVDFLDCTAFPAGCRAMVTNPPYGDGGELLRPTNASVALQKFVRHALDLTERANGQLALLVRFQWIAGKRAATLISSGPLSRVVVLTRRIQWFDLGERTNTGQHHHAWLFWDCSHGRLLPPSLVFAT